MDLTLEVWRQSGPEAPGEFETYKADDISEDMSFLEMLDVVNERLIARGRAPIAFDQEIATAVDPSPILVTLGAFDPNGDLLTFIITGVPLNGTLSDGATTIGVGDLPYALAGDTVTYTPGAADRPEPTPPSHVKFASLPRGPACSSSATWVPFREKTRTRGVSSVFTTTKRSW